MDRLQPDHEREDHRQQSGIRLGNFAAVRDNIEAEMENVVGGKKTPKQGLDDAVKEGGKILKEFASLYK